MVYGLRNFFAAEVSSLLPLLLLPPFSFVGVLDDVPAMRK